ncbi:phosphotransferase family protein [Exiguobacterium acetylicum]|uniref:phosphotransferase family protein n=1 Tax=Exiguobacterium acetylicum TaxID=41170 RepID=UPI001EE19A5E|nr:aminoglycoside phosphotransferase family protein [Exiguobacterium acetylicum]UKS57464.1 aminoglycoside phosphotransferase family protein [Exiguobacterium acetylicum]
MSELNWSHYVSSDSPITARRLTGGYTNDVYLIESDSFQQVAKIGAQRSIMTEANVLHLLHEASIVPNVLKVVDLNPACLLLIEYRTGQPMQQLITQMKDDEIEILYARLGELLATSIHSIEDSTQSSLPITPIAWTDSVSFVSNKWMDESRSLIERFPGKSEYVLSHGDFGIHNGLIDERTITLLDWEWACFSDPLLDIGWMCWFTSFHYPTSSQPWLVRFLDAYQSERTCLLTVDHLLAANLVSIWRILHRLENAPLDTQQEWTNRLVFTLSKDYRRQLERLVNR